MASKGDDTQVQNTTKERSNEHQKRIVKMALERCTLLNLQAHRKGMKIIYDNKGTG